MGGKTCEYVPVLICQERGDRNLHNIPVCMCQAYLESRRQLVEIEVSSYHGRPVQQRMITHGYILVYSAQRQASLATLRYSCQHVSLKSGWYCSVHNVPHVLSPITQRVFPKVPSTLCVAALKVVFSSW